MDLFIRFLVSSLNTINGVKNSAKKLIRIAYKTEVRRREKMLKEKLENEEGEAEYKKEDLQLSNEAKE